MFKISVGSFPILLEKVHFFVERLKFLNRLYLYSFWVNLLPTTLVENYHINLRHRRKTTTEVDNTTSTVYCFEYSPATTGSYTSSVTVQIISSSRATVPKPPFFSAQVFSTKSDQFLQVPPLPILYDYPEELWYFYLEIEIFQIWDFIRLIFV